MSKAPANLKYTKTHEWVELHGDGTASVGISDHAQDLLGDLVYVEAPEVGRKLTAGTACAVVESVKAASDVYAPLSGVVVENNATLSDSPELINKDPYGDGWIFKIKLANAADANALLDAKAYAEFCASESH